jgi:hypothetical protein
MRLCTRLLPMMSGKESMQGFPSQHSAFHNVDVATSMSLSDILCLTYQSEDMFSFLEVSWLLSNLIGWLSPSLVCSSFTDQAEWATGTYVIETLKHGSIPVSHCIFKYCIPDLDHQNISTTVHCIWITLFIHTVYLFIHWILDIAYSNTSTAVHIIISWSCINSQIKSNQSLFVTCAEFNKCRPYSEMLTYRL